MIRDLRKIRASHRWWFKQMQWARKNPNVQERRWAYQSRKSLYGVVRVERLAGNLEPFRVMPNFRLGSRLVRNVAGRLVVKFFELPSEAVSGLRLDRGF